MAITYLQAVGSGFPTCFVSCSTDGSVYTDLVWEGGTALPPQATLDAYIAANPTGVNLTNLTKLQFRKLFTLAERVAIDNAQASTTLPATAKAELNTMAIDLSLSTSVNLSDPDTIAGVNMLETVGLIASGRAAQVLAGTPPV